MEESKKAISTSIMPALESKTAEDAPLLLLVCIDQRWQKYLDAFKLFRKEPTGDSIRKLRVATRQLRTLMQMLEGLHPYKPMQKVVRSFKGQLDDLDRLRDAQVRLALIEADLGEFPALEPFKEYEEKQEAKAVKRARKEFKDIQPGETAKTLVRWVGRLDENDLKDMPECLLEPIDEAYRITCERQGRVNPEDPATIHPVRLAFKKFRYRIEVTQPMLRLFTPGALDCLKTHQGRMGAVQDLRILLQGLEDYARDHPEADLAPAMEHYRERLGDAVIDFMKHEHLLDDFWRPGPGQPFPWRKQNEDLPAQTWNCDGA